MGVSAIQRWLSLVWGNGFRLERFTIRMECNMKRGDVIIGLIGTRYMAVSVLRDSVLVVWMDTRYNLRSMEVNYLDSWISNLRRYDSNGSKYEG